MYTHFENNQRKLLELWNPISFRGDYSLISLNLIKLIIPCSFELQSFVIFYVLLCEQDENCQQMSTCFEKNRRKFFELWNPISLRVDYYLISLSLSCCDDGIYLYNDCLLTPFKFNERDIGYGSSSIESHNVLLHRVC